MISLMGREIPRDRFASYVEGMKAGFQEFGLSAFEAMVAIAISYFNDEKADIVVLETGMGGRLDATTIEGSRPLLSVITSVIKEHTRFLGNSLEEIAFHKAGIISPGCPLVYGQIPEEAETASGRKVLIAGSLNPIVRKPLFPSAKAFMRSRARSAFSRMFRASGRNTLPASVSSTTRLVRWKSAVPSSSSSFRIWMLSGGWEICSLLAALPK